MADFWKNSKKKLRGGMQHMYKINKNAFKKLIILSAR